MTAYALAHLRREPIHADVLEYMERVQATLAPFGGRFIVHGGTTRRSSRYGQHTSPAR